MAAAQVLKMGDSAKESHYRWHFLPIVNRFSLRSLSHIFATASKNHTYSHTHFHFLILQTLPALPLKSRPLLHHHHQPLTSHCNTEALFSTPFQHFPDSLPTLRSPIVSQLSLCYHLLCIFSMTLFKKGLRQTIDGRKELFLLQHFHKDDIDRPKRHHQLHLTLTSELHRKGERAPWKHHHSFSSRIKCL